tara:strand:- start:59 stop:1207 length:1149 start_codon:yes stop_codon:yes gene_type:complete
LSSQYFKIFQNSGDHKHWDKLIEYSAVYPGLDDEFRQRLANVLAFLKNELGKGFLKSSSKNHPINQLISDRIVSSALRLIYLGEFLQDLKKQDCNYDHLLSKLIKLDKCEKEGIPFIWISKPFFKSGFHVQFIVEKPDTQQKHADIKLIDKENGQEVIIEVSRLYSSDKIKDYSKQYNHFSSIISDTPPILLCTGNQILPVPEEMMSDYCNKIKQLKNDVIKSMSPKSLSDKYFELVIHPEAPKEGILYQSFQGIETSYDFTDRMISNYKIHEEAKQIPESTPGLIYIKTDFLFFLSADINTTIAKLEKHIAQYRNLIGLAIYAHIDGDPFRFDFKHEAGHIYKVSQELDGSTCYFLFVKNNTFCLPCSELTLSKLENTFIN